MQGKTTLQDYLIADYAMGTGVKGQFEINVPFAQSHEVKSIGTRCSIATMVSQTLDTDEMLS